MEDGLHHPDGFRGLAGRPRSPGRDRHALYLIVRSSAPLLRQAERTPPGLAVEVAEDRVRLRHRVVVVGEDQGIADGGVFVAGAMACVPRLARGVRRVPGERHFTFGGSERERIAAFEAFVVGMSLVRWLIGGRI